MTSIAGLPTLEGMEIPMSNWLEINNKEKTMPAIAAALGVLSPLRKLSSTISLSLSLSIQAARSLTYAFAGPRFMSKHKRRSLLLSYSAQLRRVIAGALHPSDK